MTIPAARNFCKRPGAKTAIKLLPAALLVLALCSPAAARPAKDQAAPLPFAVVELFTSEGCSSCPPADELLRQMTRQARQTRQRIFTLSFHVDYWNGLGWEDPFSRPQFTAHQYDYGRALHASSVYTPQMIVNGTDSFVGSNGRQAAQALAAALKTPAAHSIALKADLKNPNTIGIDYDCPRPRADEVLHFALVQRGLQTRVQRGENAGSLLRHDNVVRAFQNIAWHQEKGRVEFPRPEGDLKDLSVIAYAQKIEGMRITAAQALDLELHPEL